MRLVVLVVALVVVLAVPAHAATKTVQLSGTSFSPTAVKGPSGTTVRWEKTDGFHNVVSTTGMFASGAATGSDFTFSRVFSAGTFRYICEIHADFGMRGAVRIRPRASAAPDGKPFTVRWASDATNVAEKFTVQYRVNGGRWRSWRTGTSADGAVFGKGGAPVAVVSGRTYGFRVKSLQADGDASSFSPVRTFTP